MKSLAATTTMTSTATATATAASLFLSPSHPPRLPLLLLVPLLQYLFRPLDLKARSLLVLWHSVARLFESGMIGGQAGSSSPAAHSSYCVIVRVTGLVRHFASFLPFFVPSKKTVECTGYPAFFISGIRPDTAFQRRISSKAGYQISG
jgi:hypothetical protein